MKTVLNLLKEKLNTLGYNETIINSTISKFDLALVENASSNIEDLNEVIIVKEYEKPNVEIIRMFLNVDDDMIQCEILEGDIKIGSTETAVGSRFVIADYTLSRRNAIIGMTMDFKIKIILYNPTQKIINLYNNMTYEQAFKKERDEVTFDYYNSFLQNAARTGRTNERKIKEIFTLLVSDFVIDEITINDLNPRFRTYDDERKYAENLYSYSIRYINLKNNRVEFIEQNTNIKMKAKNVQVGLITNDPYVKADKPIPEADFPLNTISYYWVNPSKGIQEQLAIYVPQKVYSQAMYSELKKDDPRVDNLSRDITRRFRQETNLDIDVDDIKDILKKLNFELMCPSVDFIRANMPTKTDPIEPIKYKYKIVTDPAEFEEKLYITIEDHMARRYKYKLVENILEDLTTIGNKLEYTDAHGELVRKQSVADFNVNMPAVIIRRETFIDVEGIPDLLGYIYQDIKYNGTDALPVPNIEVVFYMPPTDSDRGSVLMYNGTSLEFRISNMSSKNFYSSDSYSSNSSYVIGGQAKLPGSTTVTVRYINSSDEILKENVIANVFPKASYLPDAIPVINDKEGKEWILEKSEVPPIILSSREEENVIELKYIEKYARVNFSIINREGKKLTEDKQELIQVGTNYDFSLKEIFKDSNADDWKLVNTRPSKIIISEFEEKNKIILVYDIERAEVIIRYANELGEAVAPDKVIQSTVDKLYKPTPIPYIVDSNGLGWNFVQDSDATILVKNTEKNIVTLKYEVAKQRVIRRIKSRDGSPLVDDKVVFEQIGKKFSEKFDDSILDLDGKEWILSDILSNNIVVNADVAKNLIEAVYKPKLAAVAIRFVDQVGREIRELESIQAQVGARFNADSMNEIVDGFGKHWVSFENDDGIIVSEKELQNSVTLKYKPLVANVIIKYFDSEARTLSESESIPLQVGTVYKPKPVHKITDDSGRRWRIEDSNIATITVERIDEDNIINLYYDKENTKARISFFDVYGNVLRDELEVEAQIGAVYDTSALSRIIDNQGAKWAFESSEPKNLLVKEGSNIFKFKYGEVKAKVLVKHINVATEKTIIEDVISTIKLGGIFTPNIRQTVLDKNKWQWKYVGEENISIVTKENEQENIIVLTYEEDRSNVTLRYQSTDGKTVRNDVVKAFQIGKELKVDHIQKVYDQDGLGWKFSKSNLENQVVVPEGNLIIDTYEPLLASVVTKYIDKDNGEEKEIVKQKEEKIQVGKKYVTEIIDRITDPADALWSYTSVSDNEIIVKEDSNVISCSYEKTLAKVTVQYVDENKNPIAEPIIKNVQIGTTFNTVIENNFEDTSGRAWIYGSVDREKIKVQEDITKNIIIVSYKKEMVELKLCFYGKGLQTIKPHQIVKAQIGSIYIPQPPNVIMDDKSLGWEVKENEIPKFKVKRNPQENVVNVTYGEYLVDAIVQFIDENKQMIMEPSITKHQVGVSFLPKIEDYIEDKEGREWVYSTKVENKVFTIAKKIEPIIISEAVGKNVIRLVYSPSLAKVTLKYKDAMGNDIKVQTSVEAQIGSKYVPEVIKNIVATGNIKWSYNPNSKIELKVSREEKKNVINITYDEQKAGIIYKYVDEDNNVLKDEKRVLAQIGSVHRVDPENIITRSDETVWEYKAKSQEEIKVDDDENNNVITIVYMPLKVDVVLKFLTLNGNAIMPNKIIKAQLGSNFKFNPEQTITDPDSKLYKLIKIEPNEIKVKEVTMKNDGIQVNETNVFEITYEASYCEVRIIFKDIDGNKLRDDDIRQMQVGTLFAPDPIRYVTDRKKIQWELIDDKIEPLRVMEDIRQNQITMVYEVAKAEISVRFKDTDGNMIKDAKLYYREVGSEFIPEIENEIVDSQNKKWAYVMTDPIKLNVGSINNIINVVYQEKKAMTVVKIQATDGKTLREDVKAKKQVGSKYVPVPATKVIYDDSNNIWRFAFNSPSDIIVSENESENVIIQYFTMDDLGRVEEKEKKFNPDISRFIDKDLVAEEEKKEAEKKKLEEEKLKKEQEKASAEQEVKFEDEHLQKLERSMKLTNREKSAINKLNDYNTEVVQILKDATSYEGNLDEFNLYEKLDKIISEEKNVVNKELEGLINDDKTGNKILKIFEAITASEMTDPRFNMLQQRKAILFADYFVNKNITPIEEVSYIVERGKNTKEIECINEKIANTKKRDEALVILKITLMYEKVMLDNYYRARSIIKDEYFDKEESRVQMSNEVIVGVTNTLPTQAIKLFNKAVNLSVTQRNELEAIMRLLSVQQRSTVQNGINQIADGKVKKMATKIYKEISG